MLTGQLNSTQRTKALKAMSEEELDIFVIGGGITGAGIALDAVSRGLNVGIVEAQDWASGTSSRSSRMMHGGLRYLYQLDFKLVAEALHERGLLMTTIAPHLVRPQPFLWPLKMPVIERAYSAVGVGMYDALAVLGAGGKKIVPTQKHYDRDTTKLLFEDVDDSKLIGSIRYFDSRVDDARMVIAVIRTAVGGGAHAAARSVVESFDKNDQGRVIAAHIRDLETNETYVVRAKEFIQATGVWTEQTQSLASEDGGLHVLASKGSHVLIPRDRLKGKAGLFLRTEKSVLFIIPWQYYWVIGTTDTAYHESLRNPVPTRADIDYILAQANSMLDDPLTIDDVIGTYAGLRPLLQPQLKEGSSKDSTKVSREHTVTQVAPGLTAIAGGKYTTYRVMAEDAVDFVLGSQAKRKPTRTQKLGVVGSNGYDLTRAQAKNLTKHLSFTDDTIRHLLGRYGSELTEILNLIEQSPELAEPLEACNWYIKAEVAFAAHYEGVLHLEDIFVQRIRLNSETRDRGLSAVDEVTDIIAPILGWDDAKIEHEKTLYRTRAQAEIDAEAYMQDSEAAAVRDLAPETTPFI